MSPSNNPLQLFLNRLLARSVLSEEEQSAVLGLPGRAINLIKGHDFVHTNEETSYACLVVTGIVARFGQTGFGSRQTTAFHIPGDMADLHSTVRPIGIGGLNALTNAVILRIPHAALRTLAAQYPAIAEAFWRDCMLDAAILMQWVVSVGRRDARMRIAHIICEMAVRLGDDREVMCEFALPITQEQLADAAALTSVHVNRSLKTLADLMSMKGGRVVIHDWAGLASAGEFEADYLTADTVPNRQKQLIEAA